MAAEQQIAAAGYIVTFFNDTESLTNTLGQYFNILQYMRVKYPQSNDYQNFEQEDLNQLTSTIQTLKFWAMRSYVKTYALKSQIKEFEKDFEELKTLYMEIQTKEVPDFLKTQEFVLALNKIFVIGIVSDLINRANELYGRFSTNANQ